MINNQYGVSKKFITITISAFILFLLVLSLSFNALLSTNTRIIKETLLKNNEYLLHEKSQLLIPGYNFRSIQAFTSHIRQYCTNKPEFLYAIIYSRTGDENYFEVMGRVPLHPSMKVNVEINKSVRENKEENFLKAGLFKPVVESKIYTQNKLAWQNVYYPVRIRSKDHVCALMISAARTYIAIGEYEEYVKNVRIYIIIGTSFIILILLITGFIFMNNFTLLIGNLSESMQKVTKGELNVNLNPDSDEELSELALSFNSLIDEMRELKEKEKILQELDNKDSLDDIFSYGVSLLKEGNLADAMIIFKSLIIMKPESFGSHFNLGVIHAKQRNYPDSLEMFKTALRFNPDNELINKYINKINTLNRTHGEKNIITS